MNGSKIYQLILSIMILTVTAVSIAVMSSIFDEQVFLFVAMILIIPSVIITIKYQKTMNRFEKKIKDIEIES